MTFELRHLQTDKRTVCRDVGGDELRVTYRPGAVSHRLLAQFRSASAAAAAGDEFAEVETIDALIAFLADAIIEWNVTDNGTPVPVSRDTLSALPLEAVGIVWTAIQEDIAAPGKASSSSAGGSRRAAPGPRTTGGRRPTPGR